MFDYFLYYTYLHRYLVLYWFLRYSGNKTSILPPATLFPTLSTSPLCSVCCQIHQEHYLLPTTFFPPIFSTTLFLALHHTSLRSHPTPCLACRPILSSVSLDQILIVSSILDQSPYPLFLAHSLAHDSMSFLCPSPFSSHLIPPKPPSSTVTMAPHNHKRIHGTDIAHPQSMLSSTVFVSLLTPPPMLPITYPLTQRSVKQDCVNQVWNKHATIIFRATIKDVTLLELFHY